MGILTWRLCYTVFPEWRRSGVPSSGKLVGESLVYPPPPPPLERGSGMPSPGKLVGESLEGLVCPPQESGRESGVSPPEGSWCALPRKAVGESLVCLPVWCVSLGSGVPSPGKLTGWASWLGRVWCASLEGRVWCDLPR